TAVFAQPGSIGQFQRPAVQGDDRGDHIARRAGGFRHNASFVAGQGIDETALADVGCASDDDSPWHGQMPADTSETLALRQDFRSLLMLVLFPMPEDLL